MEKNTNQAIDDFLDLPEEDEISEENEKVINIGHKEGLIERVDKIYVTKDGRQLLREVY
jgi:hypothetical protein